MVNNLEKYKQLSEKYSSFVYEDFKVERAEDKLNLYYKYSMKSEMDEDIVFWHRVSYEYIGGDRVLDYEEVSKMDAILFNIGMVEAVNYYKLTCAKKFVIKCGSITKEQEKFWTELFYNGLGEFIYLNGLTSEFENGKMFNFVQDLELPLYEKFNVQTKGLLIPIGGGKDSVVTLEIFKSYKDDTLPFLMNAPVASYDCIREAGFDSYLKATRKFDKRLFDLNELGYLNGHIPFSAVLGFISVLGAILTGKRYVALSNESSANEPTVHGQTFNHQYSKSFGFEMDFYNYIKDYVCEDVYYFSALRKYLEIEIADLFSKHEKYHNVFRSCNRGKKENVWCGECAKCLFVYIILSPTMSEKQLKEIFGSNLLDKKELEKDFKELIGLTDKKPFECVGTVSEVKYSLKKTYDKYLEKAPYLLEKYKEVFKDATLDKGPVEANIPEEFRELIK